MRTIKHLPLALLALALSALALPADDEKKDDPKPPEAGTLLVIDAGGKEHKVKGYTISAGTQRLAWLATDKDEPAPAKEKPKAKKGKAAATAGPEALLFRDEEKIHFVAGVETLIPVSRLRTVSFDAEKQTMTVKAAVSDKAEDDVIMTGTTRFAKTEGINRVEIDAEVDKGNAGIAELKYTGGVPKGNLKSILFPVPKFEADKEKPGRPVVVETMDKDTKKVHKVTDLLALYEFRDGKQKLVPTLLFRKTLKIDVDKLKTITAEDGGRDTVWQITQKDGDESSLTLIEKDAKLDDQACELVGLVGKVPYGYKRFPIRRIKAIHFDSTKGPDEKRKLDT